MCKKCNTIDNEISKLEKELEEKKKLRELVGMTDNNSALINLSKEYERIHSLWSKNYGTTEETKYNEQLKVIGMQMEELLSEDKKLAIILHSRFCHWNHTDGCGWFYFVKNGLHDWSEYSHKEYLEKAQKVLRVTDFETVVKVIDALK